MTDIGTPVAEALNEPSTEHGRWLWLWFKGHGHDGLAFLRAILSIEAEARSRLAPESPDALREAALARLHALADEAVYDDRDSVPVLMGDLRAALAASESPEGLHWHDVPGVGTLWWDASGKIVGGPEDG